MPGSKLLARIQEISEKAHLGAVAVAFHDFESALRFSYQGERSFHAASTFKAALLFALFKAAEEGAIRLDDHLQVRNRFVSIADGGIFRIDREHDGDSSVHRSIGRSLPVLQLARAMIVRSSNLATNLLLDYLTLDFVRKALSATGLTGVEVRRGVEDLAAFEQGLCNEATAEGLVGLFHLFLDERHLSEASRQQALDILFAQEFRSMLPARLPEDIRIAHKTGEISTHCHDAGIVFPEGRRPYVVAIMTETRPETEKRVKAVAEISGAVYRYLVGSAREERAP